MNKKIRAVNDEIDLFELIQIIWKGKWKIVAAIVISIISTFSYMYYYTSNNPKIFTATTEIRPITVLKEMDYFYINHIKFYTPNDTEFYIPTTEKNLFEISEESKEIEKLRLMIDEIIIMSEKDIKKIAKLKDKINELKHLNSKIAKIEKLERKINEMEDNKENRGRRIKIIQNFFEFPKIERSDLFKYYLEALEPKNFFVDAIRKFNLLDIDQYSNEEAYSTAINKLASTVRILPKINDATGTKYAIIEFTYYDLEKWKAVLKYADEVANKNVKKKLQTRYNKIISIMEQDRNFNLEDFSTKINNIIKEIKLTKRRSTTKESVAAELFHLERVKKTLEQDRTIERARSILETSPLATDNNDFSFLSSDISITSLKPGTSNINSYSQMKMLILALLIGATIGMFYVIVTNELQFQKKARKK